MAAAVKISATIITFNEDKKIERCLQSLMGVADEIVVVDSYSTDQTADICARYPVVFIRNTFDGYIAQKNYAVRQASHDYVLSLDADEVLSDRLKASILAVKSDWGPYDGYSFNRFNNYCGKWIHFCGWYPDRKIRLWDRRKAKWGGEDPHDKVVLSTQHVKRLKGDLLHYAYFTVDEHLAQMHKFAEVAAKAKYRKGKKPVFIVHVVFNPMFKFFRKYLLQLGFLDGYYGFVFCATTSALNFYKYLRLYEYHRSGLPDERLKQ
jgi:glycosyltransferase involved in cell wall biosynthesis